MEDEVRRFKQKKLDELRRVQAHKDDSPAAKEVWRKAVADIKDIDAALRGGANTLAGIKTATSHNASLVSEINKELGIAEEVVVAKEAVVAEKAVVEPEQTSDGGVFSARLEALISAALQDGVLTEQEKAILKKRAEAEGEDWDEVEMIINARLAERQPIPLVESHVVKNIVSENNKVVEPHSVNVPLKIIQELRDNEANKNNNEKHNSSKLENKTIPSNQSQFPRYLRRIGRCAYENGRGLKGRIIDLSQCVMLEKIEFGTFMSCHRQEVLKLPCSLIEIEEKAFKDCSNLYKVDFSQCNRLKKIGAYAFEGCSRITQFDFSQCISLSNLENNVFDGCNNLRVIDFSGCLKLNFINNDFKRNNLKVIMPSGQKSFYSSMLFDNIDISNCNFEYVPEKAFVQEVFEEIIIPDSVGVVGSDGLDNVGPFYECNNLRTIVMPASLKKINAPIGGKLEQLTKIDFSKVINLKIIPQNFIGSGCGKMKELIIPQGVEEIKNDAFVKLNNLRRLFLPPSLNKIGDLGMHSLRIYCFSPLLEELEPLVYGWDDENNWEENGLKVELFVLPDYLEKYVNQRKAERIPENVLIIRDIPEEYRYYYDN